MRSKKSEQSRQMPVLSSGTDNDPEMYSRRKDWRKFIIKINGEILLKSLKARRFVQSFTLREQGPCNFYVLNDIFNYQDTVYHDETVDNQMPKSVAHELPPSSSVIENEPTNQDVLIDKTRVSTVWSNPTETAFSSEEQSFAPPESISPNPSEPIQASLESQESTPPISPPDIVDDSTPKSWAQMASKLGQQHGLNQGKPVISNGPSASNRPSNAGLNPRGMRQSTGDGMPVHNTYEGEPSQGPPRNSIRGSYGGGPPGRGHRGGGRRPTMRR